MAPIEKYGTVRLEIPKISFSSTPKLDLNKLRLTSIFEPEHFEMAENTSCTICGGLYPSCDDKLSEIKVNSVGEQNDWKHLVFKALSIHLNTVDLYGQIVEGGALDVTLENFHLCPSCKKLASILVELDRKLEAVLHEIGSTASSFRGFIISDFVKNPSNNIRQVEFDCRDGKAFLQHFKFMAVDRGPHAAEVEVIENESSVGVDQCMVDDFGCIETVSSVHEEAQQEDITDIRQQKKSKGNLLNISSTSVDIKYETVEDNEGENEDFLSPPFSPISIIGGEPYELEPQESQEYLVPESTSDEIPLKLTPKSKEIKNPKEKRGNTKAKGLKSEKTTTVLYEKPKLRACRSNVDSGHAFKIPRIDKEGYYKLSQLGRPYKRLEVPLPRVSTKQSCKIRESKKSRSNIQVNVGCRLQLASAKQLIQSTGNRIVQPNLRTICACGTCGQANGVDNKIYKIKVEKIRFCEACMMDDCNAFCQPPVLLRQDRPTDFLANPKVEFYQNGTYPPPLVPI